MNITEAIQEFNKLALPAIEVHSTRDGRMVAQLPRLGREIIVEGSLFNPEVKVTAADLAALCEEARLSTMPGMALLAQTLGAFSQLDAPANEPMTA